MEGVPGYAFSASGTSLRFVPQPGDGPYEYQSYWIELRGAYQAPDRSRLEVVAREDGPPLSDPGIFFLGVDAIVVVGDRRWLVSENNVQDHEADPGHANLLLNALRSPEMGGFTWVSSAACRFSGEAQLGPLSTAVQVEVGPGALPHTIIEEMRYEPPNEPRRAYDLTYRLDFAQVPEIEAPGP